jgi:hypothetical protein
LVFGQSRALHRIEREVKLVVHLTSTFGIGDAAGGKLARSGLNGEPLRLTTSGKIKSFSTASSITTEQPA